MRVLTQGTISHQPVMHEGVRQAVIYDEDGSILAAMWERDDGTIALTRVGEKDFDSLVEQLGLNLRLNVKQVQLT